MQIIANITDNFGVFFLFVWSNKKLRSDMCILVEGVDCNQVVCNEDFYWKGFIAKVSSFRDIKYRFY